MNFNEYQELAQRTSNTKNYRDKIANGVMGLNGEAGECIDLVKKWEFQGHNLNVEELKEELGDVLWYIAECATGVGLKLEDIAIANIDKLHARYPYGFDADKSINREI